MAARSCGRTAGGLGSFLWEKPGLRISLLASNSAFVLQVMHPSIGTVVGQLPAYLTDPWGRAARSFASVQTWVYGGRTAIEEGKRLRETHKPLVAVDEQGRSHHALSAEPWAWVAPAQPRCPGATEETSAQAAGDIVRRLREAGFTRTRVETLDLKPPVVCVLAWR